MMLLVLLLLGAVSMSTPLRVRPTMILRTVALGMGCFWGPQERLSGLEGVRECVAGYTGGTDAAPTYGSVCNGNTGHVEAVRVTFDDDVLPLETLLQTYLSHWRSQKDVTSLKRQYSPNVWLESGSDVDVFKNLLTSEELDKGIHGVSTLAPFYRAEGYHQDYEKKQRPRYFLLGVSLVIDLLPNQDPLLYKIGATMTLAYIAIVLGERFLQGKVAAI